MVVEGDVGARWMKGGVERAYLSKLLGLFFPLCAILIFLDGAEDEVDLGDDDFGE